MKKIDKRSKEWRAMTPKEKMEYNDSQKSKGLGDTIAKITKATKIDKLVKKVVGEDCGCEERQTLLNKLFPYSKSRLSCDDFDSLDTIKPWDKQGLSAKDAGIVLRIYQTYVDRKQKWTSCVPCWKRMVDGVKRLHAHYLVELKELEDGQ